MNNYSSNCRMKKLKRSQIISDAMKPKRYGATVKNDAKRPKNQDYNIPSYYDTNH